MEFNLGKKHKCVECKLKSRAGDEDVSIDYLQFRGNSVLKISDIMKKGVQRDNQNLIVENIVMKRNEYDKLTDKRYEAIMVGLADIGNNYVSAIEFVLGNIDISFNFRDVHLKGEDVYIDLAHITAYPFGDYKFRELDE